MNATTQYFLKILHVGTDFVRVLKRSACQTKTHELTMTPEEIGAPSSLKKDTYYIQTKTITGPGTTLIEHRLINKEQGEKYFS